MSVGYPHRPERVRDRWLGGCVSVLLSVVGKAKRTLERHRQIKADAARDRAQRERSVKEREARMGQGGGLTHLGP